jgi:hypothetical protein
MAGIKQLVKEKKPKKYRVILEQKVFRKQRSHHPAGYMLNERQYYIFIDSPEKTS